MEANVCDTKTMRAVATSALRVIDLDWRVARAPERTALRSTSRETIGLDSECAVPVYYASNPCDRVKGKWCLLL